LIFGPNTTRTRQAQITTKHPIIQNIYREMKERLIGFASEAPLARDLVGDIGLRIAGVTRFLASVSEDERLRNMFVDHENAVGMPYFGWSR
jgi:hypothetical protein